MSWPSDDPLMVAYHDTEWGLPLHDDQKLSSISYSTARRQGSPGPPYSGNGKTTAVPLHGFDPKVVARYSEKDG